MTQEKMNREIRVMLQPSLYKEFKKCCDNNYKTLSEVMRDMIVKYTKDCVKINNVQ